MKKYLDAARGLSKEERGKLLENDSSFTDAHQELATEGQTDASSEQVNHHYVALVNFKNQLFELNGNKPSPIPHGPTNDDSFLLVIILNLENRNIPFVLMFNKSIKILIFYSWFCRTLQKCVRHTWQSIQLTFVIV